MNILYCPVCRSKLEIFDQLPLETLLEHVMCVEPSIKDAYRCSNARCETHVPKVMWNSKGELYASDLIGLRNLIFINNNDGPFGSFERKYNEREIKGQNDRSLG